MELVASITQRLSVKAFGIGMMAVVALYALLFTYLFITQTSTQQALESHLDSQTVLIDGVHLPQVTQVSAEGIYPEETQSDEDILKANMEDKPQSLDTKAVEGLYEQTKFGLLPVAPSSANTPFKAYKKPFILNRNQPFIGIIVQDFGLSEELSELLLSELPASISLMITPYSHDVQEWVDRARADGHEVWLNLPVETQQFPMIDPGAKGLLTRVNLQYNQDRLKWVLGRATNYAGIASYTDSALNEAKNTFEKAAKDIFGRGLGYLELNNSKDSFFYPLAEQADAPRAKNMFTIDFLATADRQMQNIYTHINNRGGAIVVVKASRKNATDLKQWLQDLHALGITIAPISAIADTNRG